MSSTIRMDTTVLAIYRCNNEIFACNESERSIVEGNRELIRIYEEKVIARGGVAPVLWVVVDGVRAG
jgi:hypothetical protein